MKKKRCFGIICVRSNSNRLPNKCFLKFGEHTLIEHIIKRCKYNNIDPIICTSKRKIDQKLIEIAVKNNIKYFRGDLNNKMKRMFDCATNFKLKSFHTIDADDPFFEGDEINKSMSLLMKKKLDIVTPSKFSQLGRAVTGYSVNTSFIKNLNRNYLSKNKFEHFWELIDCIGTLKIAKMKHKKNDKLKIRLTLDYKEDYWMLESLRKQVGNFAKRNKIINFIKKNPDFYKINWFRNKDYTQNINNYF